METLTPKSARKILNAAHFKYLCGKSTMPLVDLESIANKKVRKLKTTNGITNAIIDYITYVGGFANRINSTGRKIKTKNDREIYIPGTTKRGTPDIDVVFKGLAIKIEVKNVNTKDTISKDQDKVRAQLQAAGALYFVAPTFEAFLNWFIPEILEKKNPLRA